MIFWWGRIGYVRTSMSEPSPWETFLAAHVAEFLKLPEVAYEERKKALAWVCLGVGRLLDSLLTGERWGGWIDNVFPGNDFPEWAVTVESGSVMSLRGTAPWAKDVCGPFWIEPFFARLRLSEDRQHLDSYEIGFADASRDLRQFRHGQHIRRENWCFPEKWMFYFTGPESP